jgi:two-component system NarL family response regulator
MSIRVMLVDDHQLVREALRDALAREPDIDVVAEAGSGSTALELARESGPDVVVIDVGLPDMSGAEVATRIRGMLDHVKIVALSGYSDKRFVTEMLRAGAGAYVSKSSAGSELVRAVRAVTQGQSSFSPEIAATLAREFSDATTEGAKVAQLGRRELQVLRLVAAGLRSGEIAERLQISPATVDVHRRNLMRKLDMRSVADLTRYAIREGLVDA